MNTDDVIRVLEVLHRAASETRDKRAVKKAVEEVKHLEFDSLPMMTEYESQLCSRAAKIVAYKERVGCSFDAASKVVESYEV